MIVQLQRRLRQALPPDLVPDFDALMRKLETPRSAVWTPETEGARTLTMVELEPAEDTPVSQQELLGTRERYVDLGLLGTGGMAEVRRVRDRDLGCTLAMKIIRADLMDHPDALARFIEEAQCSAQLQHPGIVPVHELGRLPDGRFYFTMQEVRGRRLSEVIAEVHAASEGHQWRAAPSGWTFRSLVDTFHRVCEAVAYAHGRGVVHRDLKPANIMVGAHGEVLVLDWGLAKVRGRHDLAASTWSQDAVVTDRSQDDSLETHMGAVGGTPAYMPPEQAQGAIDQIDARSDVYALGAILYQILSGRPPYVGHTAQAVLAQVRAGAPPPPGRGSTSAAPSPSPPLPAELVAACVRAMARAPAERFADAGSLSTEVAAWLDGARLRAQALAVVAQAEAHAPEVVRLQARADVLDAEAAALLRDVEPWQPEEDKRSGWARADEAADLRREADRLDLALEQGLTGALRIDPTLPEAHAALAARHRIAHAEAEDDRDNDRADRAALLLQTHAEALPDDHPERQRCATYLEGHGALTLVTDPPGAEVLLYRETPRHRRLEPVFERIMGRTPLSRVSLPMGSYRCVLRAPGRAEVTYPVHITRGAHWHGVPPGGHEAQAIRLPAHHELGPDDCYVPAGWFIAGGDPVAFQALPRQRVWVDGFCMSRFPATNREYLTFLDDLVAQGREDEALRHAPRELSGTAAERGALIYGYADGRFSLRADSDGDQWLESWPISMVDWYAATAFAVWRASRTGQGWRLPHELEWAKAARGVDGRLYPWGDAFDPSWCHMKDSHQGRHLPSRIGAYPVDKSVYGAGDLVGNMRDWTSTSFVRRGLVADGERCLSLASPRDLGEGMVHRGGSWDDDPRGTRVASRYGNPPVRRVGYASFRLARSL